MDFSRIRTDAEIGSTIRQLDEGVITQAQAEEVKEIVAQLIHERGRNLASRQHHKDGKAKMEAELTRLRRLDAQYGRVEMEIVMGDPAFDGDGPGDCGDRLIASVHRMQDAARALSRIQQVLQGSAERTPADTLKLVEQAFTDHGATDDHHA